MTRASQPALWQQLLQVADAAQQVFDGHSLTDVLAAVPAGMRPGVQALSFQVLRNWGYAQASLALMVPKKPPAGLEFLMASALALLAAENLYQPFTLVDQAVHAAKQRASTRPLAGLVNAVLRRYLQQRDALDAQTGRDIQARWNHPRWWVQRLRHDHRAHWQELLTLNNEPPPMTLRVNRLKTTPGAYVRVLQTAGIQARVGGPDAVVLDRPMPVAQIPGFAQGLASVQDAAAQQAAPLLTSGLQPRAGPRLRLLDACAAPGGKTGHLLECAPGADLLALDADARRCERVGQNLARLGLNAQVKVADAMRPQAWHDGRQFDGILLDAPCSASGIVRRHPDIRWLRRATDIDRLASQQQRLLEALWPLVAPGGRLLYCTCSVFLAEGPQAAQAFVSRHSDAVVMPSPGHLLPVKTEKQTIPIDNDRCDHDGFYYALFEKRR